MAGAVQFQLEAVKASEELFEQQRTERREGHIEAMKQKWQDDYDATVTKIDSAAEKLGVKDFLEEFGISKEPEIINMLLTIANSDSEDSLTPNGDKIETKSLINQIDEIKESDAFKQRFHPKHRETMAKYMDLNQQVANAGLSRAPRT
jgi:hypothetical protein